MSCLPAIPRVIAGHSPGVPQQREEHRSPRASAAAGPDGPVGVDRLKSPHNTHHQDCRPPMTTMWACSCDDHDDEVWVVLLGLLLVRDLHAPLGHPNDGPMPGLCVQ